jgi:hypothetical protein
MNKKLFVAFGVVMGLFLLLTVSCAPGPYREKTALDARLDSWIRSGKDIIFYSDANLASETLRLDGQRGTITTTHMVVTNGLTVTNLVSSSNGLESTNGLVVAGNITMSNGHLINTKGYISVTDGIYVAGGETVAMNGARVTGGLTVTGLSTIDGLSGTTASFTSLVQPANGVAATGGITVTGPGSFTSQVTASNGIAATGRVTVSGYLSVTTWSELYGLVLGLGSTQAVTASYGITPGASSILYVTDDGAQATGTVTLDGTVAITDGGKVGQLLIIMSRETHGATLTIPDGANTQTPAAASIVLGQYDSAMFLWDGTDWVCIGVTNN